MRLKTAIELMRSRYEAYKNSDEPYLLSTWEESFRPVKIDFSNQPKWIGLEIVSSHLGKQTDQTGTVHFKAYYIDNKKIGLLEENSRFIKKNDQWYYCDGDIFESAPFLPGRNALCPCQSGKKFKRCCMKAL